MTKIEQIRASLANMDSEIIKDTLSIILAKESVKTDTAKTEISSNYKNFAQAILSLKSKYKFAELDFFGGSGSRICNRRRPKSTADG